MKSKIVQWIIAVVSSFIIINLITIPLYHTTGWITIIGGPTDAISEPGGFIINSSEGYGINTIDEWGYSNPSTNLNENGYVLSMGSSITKGNQVMMGQKYTYLLNDMLGGTEDSLKVYNIGQDGATFDSMAKSFNVAVGEFSDAKAVTIEFCILGVTDAQVEEGFSQNEWVPGAFKNVNLSTVDKLKNIVKNYLPFATYLIENRLSGLDLSLDGAFGFNFGDDSEQESETLPLEDYENYFRDALETMRSQFDGEIILTYIPSVSLDNDGMVVTYNDKIDLLLEIAPEYDIQVVNCETVFLKEYEKDYTFPLGYSNTSYGPGHLNSKGHEIVADELYALLKEINI